MRRLFVAKGRTRRKGSYRLNSAERRLGTYIMHDFLIALAFIGMVIAPAIVAPNCTTEVTDESKSK